MSSVLSHEAYHRSVGHAFGELLVLEQISQLPAESIVRVLQTIPEPLLQRALLGRAAAVPQPTEVKEERRAEPRRKVLRGAKLLRGGQLITEVQVRDVSEGGCRIWTRRPLAVPERFAIRIVGIEGERPCEVRWRSGNELGLRFLAR
jgi:hypothetical protein